MILLLGSKTVPKSTIFWRADSEGWNGCTACATVAGAATVTCTSAYLWCWILEGW